jgi:dUTP pyrophosphatase
MTLQVYRITPRAEIPSFATEGSACFDLRVCVDADQRVTAYNPQNKKIDLPVKIYGGSQLPAFQLHPMHRVLVPTGLIFDVPQHHVLKVWIRSSMALKVGLTLANSTAIIDSDYTDQTYVMLQNLSDVVVTLQHGDRIAQAALEQVQHYQLTEVHEPPQQKTSRIGGLGSTGVA